MTRMCSRPRPRPQPPRPRPRPTFYGLRPKPNITALSNITYLLLVTVCSWTDKHHWCYSSWQKRSAVWYPRLSTTA